MEFRLLGAIEAIDSRGQPVELGHIRQRCVLAVLLVELNRAVPPDQLMSRIWGDHPPLRERNALYGYVSRLRQILRTTGSAINRGPSGYQLVVPESTVDLHRFRDLVTQARSAGPADVALVLFDQALALWRGEAFGGLDLPWFREVGAALHAERQAAEADRVDAALRCGRHAELLTGLADRADRDPLDERVAGQLILALYRSGRQADALRHYERIRRTLAQELGADPSPPLRELHQQILTGSSTPADVPATTSTIAPTTAPAAAPERSPVPRQLPAPPPWFTGREAELATLTSVLAGPTTGTLPLMVVTGTGGVGKTSLALRWAHDHLDRFPDGQLFVDLHGFAPTGRPTPPAEAIRGLLVGLGTAPDQIPLDLEARSGLYRSLIADRRMLVVLDNAADTTQVVPLLPGSPTCAVIVTSRRRLGGMIARWGAGHVGLDPLADAEARDLLAARLGAERMRAEPQAVAELVARCDGLPLALAVVTGRVAARPQFSLAALAAEFRDAASRLAALDDEDPEGSLPAVLSWSFRTLHLDQRMTFCLLGIAPGPDIDLNAAASLLGRPVAEVRRLLRGLVEASLVTRHASGRYVMHDLVRAYAADVARQDLADDIRQAALRRVVDFYMHTAYSANRVLAPSAAPLRLGPPATGSQPETISDVAAALTWFDAEHRCLLAAQRTASDQGWHQAVWNLAWVMTTFHHRRAHRNDQLEAWLTAVQAAERLPDRQPRGYAHRSVGRAYAMLGRHDEAISHLTEALAIARDNDYRLDQAHAHNELARAWEHAGEFRQALAHAESGLAIYRTVDQPRWEGDALNAVGWYAALLGDYERARESCLAALVLSEPHADQTYRASILDSLGYIDRHIGEHQRAVSYYEQALTAFREVGHSYEVANTLDGLGHAYAALNRPEQARAAWQEARELYRSQRRDTDVDRMAELLATLKSDAATRAQLSLARPQT